MERFVMRTDRRCRWITWITFLLLGGGLAFAFYTSGGSYFPAWLSTLVVSIFLLAVLSIPKSVLLTPSSIEVRCLVEVTRMAYYDIDRVKLIDSSFMRFVVPIFGVFGFFGYYGYFIDLRHFRLLRVYGRRWSNFVLIEDRRGRRVVVTVEDPLAFVRATDRYMIVKR